MTDTIWLWRHTKLGWRRSRSGDVDGAASAAHAAVLLLDASATFENVWPTPAVRWAGALSIECAGASSRSGQPRGGVIDPCRLRRSDG